ncbi:MAG: hypothetical protein Q9221_008373 [Calogaya cf. arnoldii]
MAEAKLQEMASLEDEAQYFSKSVRHDWNLLNQPTAVLLKDYSNTLSKIYSVGAELEEWAEDLNEYQTGLEEDHDYF